MDQTKLCWVQKLEITTVGSGKVAIFKGYATSKILRQLPPNYVLFPQETWLILDKLQQRRKRTAQM